MIIGILPFNFKSFRKKAIQEHISLTVEPDSRSLGHFAVKIDSAKAISDSLLNYLETIEMVTNSMINVGCDGTTVNTGLKGGTIRRFRGIN